MQQNTLASYSKRKHSVIISSNKGKGNFRAFLNKEISYDIELEYNSFFKAYLDIKNAITDISMAAGTLIGNTGNSTINSLLNKAVAPGLSWTRQMGGVPGFIQFPLPLILWVEDSTQDVTNQLSTLYDLTVPTINKTIAEISPMEVKVLIGDWFMMEQAYVTNISHKWSETLIKGFPAFCEIDLKITSVYAVDRAHLDMSTNKITVKEVGSVINVKNTTSSFNGFASTNNGVDQTINGSGLPYIP